MQHSEPTSVPGAPPEQTERWLIRVNGVVQGVGYRPFVYQLATALGLPGWVLNDTLGVQTEVYGQVPVLKTFLAALSNQAPLLARVDEVWVESSEPFEAAVPDGFEIRRSERAGRAGTVVAPDSHVCAECLREIFDPADRRYRYPFTNCTHCGPRYSLIRGLPYDREQTTMAAFTMCASCGICSSAEYEAHGPIELEGLLGRDLTMTDPYPFDHVERPGGIEVDHRPLIRRIAADLATGTEPAMISRRFHSAVVSMVVARCDALRRTHRVAQVVLSGGVFLNEFLAVNCLVELRRAGFAAYGHRLVPCNDGGISLGQVMVAGARVRARTTAPR